MNTTKKKIFAISGSTRKKSSNEFILRHIQETYKDTWDVEIYEGIDTLPHFNPDLDNETPPEIIADFRNRIKNADGVLMCTPEYVFSLPGSFKNMLDWNVSTTIFSNKPLAFIVAAASGEKAFESLNLILTTIEAKMAANSKLLINGAKGKIESNGEITNRETLDKIKLLVSSLTLTIDG